MFNQHRSHTQPRPYQRSIQGGGESACVMGIDAKRRNIEDPRE
jgi:hypothetical protein